MYAENSLCTSGLVLKGLINKGALWMPFFFSIKMLQQPSLSISLARTSPDKSLVHLIVLSSRICILTFIWLSALPPTPPPPRMVGTRSSSAPYHQSWLTSKALSFWTVIPFASLTSGMKITARGIELLAKINLISTLPSLPFPLSHCILATTCHPSGRHRHLGEPRLTYFTTNLC